MISTQFAVAHGSLIALLNNYFLPFIFLSSQIKWLKNYISRKEGKEEERDGGRMDGSSFCAGFL